jgi:hypothetical protein
VRAEREQRLVQDAGGHPSRLDVQLLEGRQRARVADPPECAYRSLANVTAAIRQPLDQNRNRFFRARGAQHFDCERATPGSPAPDRAKHHLHRADLPQPLERPFSLLGRCHVESLDQDRGGGGTLELVEAAELPPRTTAACLAR